MKGDSDSDWVWSPAWQPKTFGLGSTHGDAGRIIKREPIGFAIPNAKPTYRVKCRRRDL